MDLFILRHGLAVDAHHREKDSERLLTPKGIRKIRQVAKAMERLDLSFDLILSSPYLRARQTAEIVARAFGGLKQLQLTDTLAPGAKANQVIDVIKAAQPTPKNVLLVGHEPFLSELVSLLVSGDTGLSIMFKKGGLCKLAVEHFKPGRCACLEWLLTPKQMAEMT